MAVGGRCLACTHDDHAVGSAIPGPHAATAAVAARRAAEVALLAAAAEGAVLHPATEVTGYAGFGEDLLFGEDLVPLAGEGAPLVAEFAPAERPRCWAGPPRPPSS